MESKAARREGLWEVLGTSGMVEPISGLRGPKGSSPTLLSARLFTQVRAESFLQRVVGSLEWPSIGVPLLYLPACLRRSGRRDPFVESLRPSRMNGNEMRTPKTVSPGRQGLRTGEQEEQGAAVLLQSLRHSEPADAESVGAGGRSEAEEKGDGEAIDEELEDYKQAVLNEVILDFSWYCRKERRTREEMEDWWQQRKELIDALLEDPWPAWGTKGALRRLCEFVER